MLLLDTHVWLWAGDGDGRLGRKASRLIEHAAARDQLRVSPASVFEVTALYSEGRIALHHPVESWIEAALETDGVRVAELTVTVALEGGRIPRTVLADPVDRILVATARRLGARLVTADRAILTYAKANRLDVVDARQ